MALRDNFMKDMENAPIEDLMADPNAAPTPPDDAVLEAKMNEADMAFDEMVSEANPVGDFSANSINTLIDKVNSAMQLFGPEAAPISPVEGDVDEFPTELTKALQMLSQAATDAGIDDAINMDVADDTAVKMLAGQVDSLARNQSFKTFLKTEGGVMSGLKIEVEAEPVAAPVPSPEPEMDEDEMMKLFNSRM